VTVDNRDNVKHLRMISFSLVTLCVAVILFVVSDTELVLLKKQKFDISKVMDISSNHIALVEEVEALLEKKLGDISADTLKLPYAVYFSWQPPNKESVYAEHVRIIPYRHYISDLEEPDSLKEFQHYWDSLSNETSRKVFFIADIDLKSGLFSVGMGGIGYESLATVHDIESSDVPYMVIKRMSPDEAEYASEKWLRETNDIPETEPHPIELYLELNPSNVYSSTERGVLYHEEGLVVERLPRSGGPGSDTVLRAEASINCHTDHSIRTWRGLDLGDKETSDTGCNGDEWDPYDPQLEISIGFKSTVKSFEFDLRSYIANRHSFLDGGEINGSTAFNELFPDLSLLIVDNGNMSFSELRHYIDEELDRYYSQTIKIPILGFDISNLRKYEMCSLLILFVLLYYQLHLNSFSDRLIRNDPCANVPWIGVYTDLISRIVLVLSTMILPISILYYVSSMYFITNKLDISGGIIFGTFLLSLVVALWMINSYRKLMKKQNEYKEPIHPTLPPPEAHNKSN